MEVAEMASPFLENQCTFSTGVSMKAIALVVMMAVVGLSYGHRKRGMLIQSVKAKLDAVYLKLDDALMGATLQISRENGEIIISETILKRQILIDFFYENPGFYKIRILRDGVVESEYDYVNTSLVTESTESEERLVVLQGTKYFNRHHRKTSHLVASS